MKLLVFEAVAGLNAAVFKLYKHSQSCARDVRKVKAVTVKWATVLSVCVSHSVPRSSFLKVIFSEGYTCSMQGAERTCKALPNEAPCKILGSGS